MSSIDLATLANADYVEEQYRRFKEDPSSVDERWALFFAGFELAADGDGNGAASRRRRRPGGHRAAPSRVIGVFDLVHSYRELGHLVAHLNPLGAEARAAIRCSSRRSSASASADLDRVVECGELPRRARAATLRELIARLQATYCRHARRRVHAHPGPRAAAVAAGAHGADARTGPS